MFVLLYQLQKFYVLFNVWPHIGQLFPLKCDIFILILEKTIALYCVSTITI